MVVDTRPQVKISWCQEIANAFTPFSGFANFVDVMHSCSDIEKTRYLEMRRKPISVFGIDLDMIIIFLERKFRHLDHTITELKAIIPGTFIIPVISLQI